MEPMSKEYSVVCTEGMSIRPSSYTELLQGGWLVEIPTSKTFRVTVPCVVCLFQVKVRRSCRRIIRARNSESWLAKPKTSTYASYSRTVATFTVRWRRRFSGLGFPKINVYGPRRSYLAYHTVEKHSRCRRSFGFR